MRHCPPRRVKKNGNVGRERWRTVITTAPQTEQPGPSTIEANEG